MKVAGYSRVSTDEQERSGTSLESQRHEIQAECERLGHDLIEFYSDTSSGGNLERSGLKQLLNDAKDGKFQTVMITETSRLSRDQRDIMNTIYDLNLCNVKCHFIKLPAVNKGDPIGNFLLSMVSAVDQMELSTIRERTQKGRHKKWREGKALIGSLPIGYMRNEKKEVIIDKQGRKTYELIKSLYLYEGHSMLDIALKLQEMAIPPPQSKSRRWYTISIADILKNPSYTGEAFQNKYVPGSRIGKDGKSYKRATKELKPESEWIKVTLPALISKEEFQQIQARIDLQKHKPKLRHRGYEEHFLADAVLHCGHCGARIKKKINKGNFSYCCYWKETGAKELRLEGRKKCVLSYLPAEEIDGQIFSKIMDVVCNPSRYAREWFKDQDYEELKATVDRLHDQMAEFQRQLQVGHEHLIRTPNEIKPIYEKQLKQIEKEYLTTKKNHDNAERDLSFKKNRVDRLNEFEQRMQGSKRSKIDTFFASQAEFKTVLLQLPFKERKRVLEAVISPETGGKVFLKIFPGAEKEFDITYEFILDVNRVEAIITDLNKNALLYRVDSDRHEGGRPPAPPQQLPPDLLL